MRTTTYYIIRAKPALQAKLAKYASDTIRIFTEPTMWSRGEADRTKWKNDDYKEQIKLLFLAYLASDYSGTKYHDVQEGLDNLLGSSPWTIDTFDQWWQLERMEYDGDVEEIQKNLKLTFILQLQSKSEVVINWINRLIQTLSP